MEEITEDKLWKPFIESLREKPDNMDKRSFASAQSAEVKIQIEKLAKVRLRCSFPNASFWIVADDDIWVNVDNMKAYVEQLNSNEISIFGTTAGDALNVWGGAVGYSRAFVQWLVSSPKHFKSCSDATYEYNKRKAARPLKNYYLRFGVPVAPYHQDCYLSFCSIKVSKAMVHRSLEVNVRTYGILLSGNR
ncbi:hypothetical protein Pmar_PMAR000567 [Perkinsus marinus ATCC 50983]|uniref:Uncharacterized protein n=1 Tax=Perkinsus marinus (strain ATCC 50983 / TXsc) TaxID=423536 RepID=C5LIZ5_PERM5|nr:hypothetical protein Pmar_PMAR000567 [Perkinsus marinus ATCC 50983]EER03330.1 hypothetical protein Pmar_PMAR000567 [Perkinsus marinus ATCC 50983]|eukprot:XP_002771514.1 hypothetical protein Pmar_PMAR000567 [Perkinsus marinus ATCC 50983]